MAASFASKSNYAQADRVKTFIAQAEKHANLKPGQKPAM